MTNEEAIKILEDSNKQLIDLMAKLDDAKEEYPDIYKELELEGYETVEKCMREYTAVEMAIETLRRDTSVCRWHCSGTPEDEYWITDCGKDHWCVKSYLPPELNGYKYCPYCGRVIEEEWW